MERPPLQQRSKKTLDKILDAAEALLDEINWPAITVQDIVTRANSSVGSFYARFKNKEALLISLSDRFSNDIQIEAERLIALSDGLTLAEDINLVIGEIIKFHLQRKGIIRALTLVPRLDFSYNLRRDGLRNADIFDGLASHLARLSNDPVRTRFGLFIVSTAIREAVIFPEITQPLVNIDHQKLAEELSVLLITYLEG